MSCRELDLVPQCEVGPEAPPVGWDGDRTQKMLSRSKCLPRPPGLWREKVLLARRFFSALILD